MVEAVVAANLCRCRFGDWMRDATLDALKLENVVLVGKAFLLFSKAKDAFLEIWKQAARMTKVLTATRACGQSGPGCSLGLAA